MNHYVYLIEHKNPLPGQPVQYIGVRSCECNVGDDPYMSSSKYVKEAIKKYGKDQFNKIILKRFDSRKDAMDYEIQLHEEFNVTGSNFFFNKAKQKTNSFSCGPGELNPFYGKKHTEEYKKKLSALLKTKDCRAKTTNKGKKFPEAGPKIKESIQKRINEGTFVYPWTYKDMPSDQSERISKGLLNSKKNKKTCIYCGLTTVAGNIARFHNDKCKNKGE
jgi:hypothetical protein